MSTRAEKWAIKTNPDLLCPKLSAVHDLSCETISQVYGAIDTLYERVKPILNQYGVVGSERLMYRSYLEELYRITQNFSGQTKLIEVSAVSFKYWMYGGVKDILTDISLLFGINAFAGLTDAIRGVLYELKPIPEEGTIIADGTEQVMVQSSGVETHFYEGYLDLSQMVAGDIVVIRSYVSLVTPVDYKLYASNTFSDGQLEPVVYILSKPARYGFKMTLQQTAGPYKTFKYQFFKRVIS